MVTERAAKTPVPAAPATGTAASSPAWFPFAARGATGDAAKTGWGAGTAATGSVDLSKRCSTGEVAETGETGECASIGEVDVE